MAKKKKIEPEPEKEEQLLYQIWYKVTMHSRPKLGVVLPSTHYDFETAKEVAHTMKEQFHWAAVNVVKVKYVS
jgi:hypothetical protein